MINNNIPALGPLIAYQQASRPDDPSPPAGRGPLPPGLAMRGAQTSGIFKTAPAPSPPGVWRLTPAEALGSLAGVRKISLRHAGGRGAGSGQPGCGEYGVHP